MGSRPRFRAVALSLAVLLTAGSAALASAATYKQLRAEYPAIDRAVGAMPSSSLHGSFGRISSLLDGVEPGLWEDGSRNGVSPKLERQLVRAIDELRARLGDDIDRLSPQDRLVLLQTTSLVVFEPAVALYPSASWEFCPDPSTGCEAPAVLSALDRLAQHLVPVISGLVLEYDAAAAADPMLPAGPPLRPAGDYNSQTFSGAVDELAEVWRIVHGEPIID